MPNGSAVSGFAEWLAPKITERNCLLLLLALYVFLSILIAPIPYLPETDLADATTNDIWVEYYSEGIHHVPFDDWDHGMTQSVVVWYDGEYTVVNEKGPGHVMMLVPFYLLGIGFLFGPLMMGFATFSTYMLGKRLLNWRAGILAAALVLTNATVMVMWYRYYWTDASTMHMLVLSVWLLVEANYWFNGRSLDAKEPQSASTRQRLLALGLVALSGLAFGASVSTRYATALILIAMVFFLLVFYLIRAWPHLKNREMVKAVKSTLGFWILLGVFLLGLLIVLVPLMNYNTEYFGAPLRSGYDETLLTHFNPIAGLNPRNTSTGWSSNFPSSLWTAWENFMDILPMLVIRMPALLIVPVGIWVLRRRPLVLAFLLLWTSINFVTYLMLSWVDIYANIPLGILHEPRYFMPSLPPIALIAGAGIDRFAARTVEEIPATRTAAPEGKKIARAIVTVGIIGILVMGGLLPTMKYFSNMEYGGALRPPRPPPPQPSPVIGVRQATCEFAVGDSAFPPETRAGALQFERSVEAVRYALPSDGWSCA